MTKTAGSGLPRAVPGPSVSVEGQAQPSVMPFDTAGPLRLASDPPFGLVVAVSAGPAVGVPVGVVVSEAVGVPVGEAVTREGAGVTGEEEGAATGAAVMSKRSGEAAEARTARAVTARIFRQSG